MRIAIRHESLVVVMCLIAFNGFTSYTMGGQPDQRMPTSSEVELKTARVFMRSPHEWEPRFHQWKSWLATTAKREAAENALGEVVDPTAVIAAWKAFATRELSDQKQAVQLFGQIQCADASRALALLAVSSDFAVIRRAATETLRRRDPIEFADVLLSFLRNPSNTGWTQFEAQVSRVS